MLRSLGKVVGYLCHREHVYGGCLKMWVDATCRWTTEQIKGKIFDTGGPDINETLWSLCKPMCLLLILSLATVPSKIVFLKPLLHRIVQPGLQYLQLAQYWCLCSVLSGYAQYLPVAFQVHKTVALVCCRVYLEYHSCSQVCWGAGIGVTFGTIWFLLVNVVFTPVFPTLASWWVAAVCNHSLYHNVLYSVPCKTLGHSSV